MNEAPGFLFYILAFLLLLGPLVFLHELGHYLAGRWFGIKAEVFSIGFGREIGGFTDKRGTRGEVGWLPLGGYVKFAGDMNPAGQPSPEWLSLPAAERAQTFQAKPLWQRAIVVAAGPLTNFIVAILILAAFFVAYGRPDTPAIVAAVQDGSPAASAGILPGDRILTVGGRSVENFNDVAKYVVMRPGEDIDLQIDRAGQISEVTATAGVRTMRDRFGNEERVGLLGVQSGPQVARPVSLLEAPWAGIQQTGAILRMQIDGLGQIITGRRSVEELGGPLRIAKVSGERFAMGATEFVFLIALISINLGFINLLPVPVLDGGHLLFYAVEAVRRKPVEPQVIEWAFRGGVMAILALMLLVTFNDLGAFGVWRNLAGLIG
ncbi:RIP metalloprotease RseP [Sphingomonas turrisvirgatae]|uniref:Zinc metalloprotease n=1 Tax=Sphingomonas turrisvirgatae TaxID=1888892 RepID=A0A1E3LQV5_9SPHN|nr:RIP metalloprotease RseP [Sphingomonas turrisvirgatae]ODP36147.1 RIP metalloprotease RseP [Sphingomonas turrisvirgatae]